MLIHPEVQCPPSWHQVNDFEKGKCLDAIKFYEYSVII